MRWLYRMQQRLALTSREAAVLLVLSAVLGAGLAAEAWQQRAHPVAPTAYAAEDRRFEARHAADTLAAAAPTEAPTAPEPVAEAAPARLDLNAASAADLETLPRIGPKLAARIVAYRSAHGGFRTVEELVQVRGIGAKTLEQLAPHLYVSSHP